jgi:hypothetical protein
MLNLATSGFMNKESEFLDLRLRADAGKDDIMHAIRDAGAHKSLQFAVMSLC